MALADFMWIIVSSILIELWLTIESINSFDCSELLAMRENFFLDQLDLFLLLFLVWELSFIWSDDIL